MLPLLQNSRKVVKSAGGGGLPSELVQIKAVRTNGKSNHSCTIDTGIVFSANAKVKSTFIQHKNDGYGYGCVFSFGRGSYGATNFSKYGLACCPAYSNRFLPLKGDQWWSVIYGAYVDTEYTIEMQGSTLKIDDTTYENVKVGTPNGSLYIFGVAWSQGGYGESWDMEMSYFEVEEEGIAHLLFTPAKVLTQYTDHKGRTCSSGICGFWDEINCVFYTDQEFQLREVV